jgi:ribosome-binding protein aMBF1 (putative translation factor)
MSAHMKQHHIDAQKSFCVIIKLDNSKKSYYIPLSHQKDLENVLAKYSEDDDTPVAWEVLAKDRIEKYKKSGLVLRGMRYREGLSQKKLAEASGITQNEISNIENGRRTVGKKVAEKLAKVLNFDYRMLL